MRVQFSGEVFNLFNFANIGFLPPTLYPENPAFVYGLGILPSGQVAPVNPGFMRATINGAYDPSVVGQQGTPLQAQLGLRLLF